MLKFPPELTVHKGSVFSLLYVVGGLLMTVTAGGQCVDVAVRTAQNPATLLRLSNTLIGLVGLRYQMQAANSVVKRKLKRLHFTDSFNSLLDLTTKTLQGPHEFKVLCWFPASPERRTNLESTSANCVSTGRRRIYYILICGASSRPVLTLCVGDGGGGGGAVSTCSPSNRLRWLIKFSRNAQARGDVVFLLLGRQTGEISARSEISNAAKEPTSLTLGLSALSAVFLWMLLPYFAVCAVICFGWRAKQRLHSPKKSPE